MKSVRNKDSPTSTMFGGVWAVPSAWRRMEKTMMMRKIWIGLVGLAASAAVWAVGPAPAPMKQKEVLSVGFVKVGHLSPMLMIEEELKKLNIEVKRAEFVLGFLEFLAGIAVMHDAAASVQADLAAGG